MRKKGFLLVTQLGSNWNNSTNSGSFYWNLNNSSGNSNRNQGSHLAYASMILVLKVNELPWLLPKHNNKTIVLVGSFSNARLFAYNI